MLFGTLSSGISSKHKRSGWERVWEAVNAVGSEKRIYIRWTTRTLNVGVLGDFHRNMLDWYPF